MCQFIETIRIDNFIPQNLLYHKLRIENTYNKFFNTNVVFDINNLITIPEDCGIYKFRVVYDQNGPTEVSLTQYSMKHVNSLALIQCDNINYDFKYLDRGILNELSAQKGDCDDILIVKNDLITDTSIANIAFFDGNNWITPLNPLLRGTRRAQLINDKLIIEKKLRIADLKSFSKIRIFNAMINWGDLELQSVDSISYNYL